MAYKTKFDGQTDTSIQLGDKNNPTPVSIEGYFLGTRETPDTGYGPGKLHIFQTPEGTTGVWGKTNSNRLLTSELVGQMVLLTFTGMGEKKKGKNPAYNYSLQHDPDNTTDVSGINVNGQEPEESEGETESVDSDAEPTPAPTYASTPVVRTATPVSSAPPSNSAAQAKLAALRARKTA